MLPAVFRLIPCIEKGGVPFNMPLALKSPTILFEIFIVVPTPPVEIIPLIVGDVPASDKS